MAHHQWVGAFFVLVVLSGCLDPPLLSTPLPNGYEFKSNGGRFGYIATPTGERMANYFGIINNTTEAWCEEFGSQNELVICKRTEFSVSSSKPKAANYLILNTINSEVFIVGIDEAKTFWLEQVGLTLPKMAVKFHETYTR